MSNRRPGGTALRFPWEDDRRADAKTDLFRFVAGTSDGANLPCIVRTVFGRDTDVASADARLAHRSFTNHPDLFETTWRDGYLWVDPTPAAVYLNRRKQRAKSEDGDGFGADVPDDRPVCAKDRARATLSKWSTPATRIERPTWRPNPRNVPLSTVYPCLTKHDH